MPKVEASRFVIKTSERERRDKSQDTRRLWIGGRRHCWLDREFGQDHRHEDIADWSSWFRFRPWIVGVFYLGLVFIRIFAVTSNWPKCRWVCSAAWNTKPPTVDESFALPTAR